MSLILDALRKSERIRQQTLSGRVSASGSPFDHGRVPLPWATLIGLLLIANVIVLGVIFWRSPVTRHASLPAPAPVAAKPAAMEAAAVYRPAVRPLADEAAAAVHTVVGTSATGETTQPVAGRASSAAPATVARTTVTTSAVTRVAPAERTGAAAAGVTSTDAGVPLLDSLPLAFQQSLPALHLDVHSYSSNPAGRFVVINMQRYQKGDTLTEGPKVVAIVADGVILEYHGRKFLLPRP